MDDIPIVMQTAAPVKIGLDLDGAFIGKKDWIKADEILVKPMPLIPLLERITQHPAKNGCEP